MEDRIILIDKFVGNEEKKSLFTKWLNEYGNRHAISFVRDSNLHEAMLSAKVDIAFGDKINRGAFSIRFWKSEMETITLMLARWQEIENGDLAQAAEMLEAKTASVIPSKIAKARSAGWSVIQSGDKWVLKDPKGDLRGVSHKSAGQAWALLP